MFLPQHMGSDRLRPSYNVGEDVDAQASLVHALSASTASHAVGRVAPRRTKTTIENMRQEEASHTREAIQLLVGQEGNHVKRDTFTKVLETQKRRLYGCVSLPFSLLLFLTFAISTYLHEDITNVFLIESGLRDFLSDGLDEVSTIPVLWDWVNQTLVPRLFLQTDWDGIPLDDKMKWSRVLIYNYLQGPVVFEQLRSERARCQEGKGVAGHMFCYDKFSSSTATFGRTSNFTIPVPVEHEYSSGSVSYEERQAYYKSAFEHDFNRRLASRRLTPMRQEFQSRLPTTETGDDYFRTFIYANTNYSLIQDHINYLYDKGWLDPQSKSMSVKALLLNAEVGRPRLEQVRIMFWFSRGGSVFTRIQLESLFLERYSSFISLMADILFMIMLSMITIVELRKLRTSFMERTLMSGGFRAWNALQCFIIVCGWAVILIPFAENANLTELTRRFREVVVAQVDDVPADLNLLGKELHGVADSMVSNMSWYRPLLAEYHLVLMFRFFAAFSAQPRLGVVIRTLQRCLIDIVHFLIVLIPTFMAYAMSGMLIFGRRLEEFSTLQGSIGVCVKLLMEGEYDWDRLSADFWWTAAFWVWTFVILLVLCMLNMILAIVLEVYTQMRKRDGHGETVWQTAMTAIRMMRSWREWVSTRELIERAATLEENFSLEDLRRVFPKMCSAQAAMLHQACLEAAGVDSYGGEDQGSMTAGVQLGLASLRQTVRELHQEEQEDNSEVFAFRNPDTNRGWLQDISEQMALQNHWLLSLQWQLQNLEWQWQSMDALYGRHNEIVGHWNKKRDECPMEGDVDDNTLI
mmetsp:Transcript_43302/g.94327  ORF Transcript_43302/g.94327 Transcript_43302/m.94327 type:complete len:805 (+) Transcript_43302:121-2535(+)